MGLILMPLQTLQVYHRLCQLGMTVSYPTLIRLLDDLAVDHDQELYNWKDSMTIPAQASFPELHKFSRTCLVLL